MARCVATAAPSAAGGSGAARRTQISRRGSSKRAARGATQTRPSLSRRAGAASTSLGRGNASPASFRAGASPVGGLRFFLPLAGAAAAPRAPFQPAANAAHASAAAATAAASAASGAARGATPAPASAGALPTKGFAAGTPRPGQARDVRQRSTSGAGTGDAQYSVPKRGSVAGGSAGRAVARAP